MFCIRFHSSPGKLKIYPAQCVTKGITVNIIQVHLTNDIHLSAANVWSEKIIWIKWHLGEVKLKKLSAIMIRKTNKHYYSLNVDYNVKQTQRLQNN